MSLSLSLIGTSVRLTWSGVASPKTDVFRNGSRIATVSNSGSYTDKLPRKAKGTYSYRVCAAGTATCTAAASVTLQNTPVRFSARQSSQRATRALRRYARVKRR
jgi:hypothetical protein